MSNPNFNELSATTFKNYRPKFTDNIMKKVAVLALLKKHGGIERKRGGTSIVEPLMYGLNGTFGTYSGYDKLDSTPQKGFTAAEYQWKNASVSVTISKEEEDQNSGESRIINLLKAKIEQAEKTYILNFNQMLLGDGTGNGGKDYNGLRTFCRFNPTVSTSIGGINQSTYAYWQNQYTGALATFTTNNLGKINMRTIYNKCCREGAQPNAIITGRELFESYEGLLTEIERINFNKGSELDGDIGFNTLTYKGKPFVWDYYCTTISGEGYPMYMLNFDYLKLVVDPTTDWVMTEWRTPVDQMAKTAFILHRGEFVCNNRQLQGVLHFTSATT